MADPFFILAVCLASGIALGALISCPVWVWGLVFLLVFGVFLVLLVRRSPRSWLCLCLIFFCGGAWLLALDQYRVSSKVFHRGGFLEAKISARVVFVDETIRPST